MYSRRCCLAQGSINVQNACIRQFAAPWLYNDASFSMLYGRQRTASPENFYWGVLVSFKPKFKCCGGTPNLFHNNLRLPSQLSVTAAWSACLVTEVGLMRRFSHSRAAAATESN